MDQGYKVAKILSGASLSSAVQLGDLTVVGLILPDTWTAADITFQVSLDNVTYVNLLDMAASNSALAEYVVKTPIVSSGVPVDPTVFVAWRWVKVRSGVLALAVNQGADRLIYVALQGI